MNRLFAIRFISAGCLLLAVTMLAFDIATYKQGIGEGHGFIITTMLLIASSLELVRSELVDLRKKFEEKI